MTDVERRARAHYLLSVSLHLRLVLVSHLVFFLRVAYLFARICTERGVAINLSQNSSHAFVCW